LRLRIYTLLVFLPLLCSAQTLLQRCIGEVPDQEPRRQLGPSPATMSWCRQLPGWNLYERAGELYQGGDHAGASRLALQAAEQGNPIAQLRVAMMYAKGDGVAVNLAAAGRWYKAAAAQGEPGAENLLGTIYEYGSTPAFAAYGIADNWDVAARLWQASAAQGWAPGEFSLGRAFQYGIGVPLNLESAIHWYEKAAAQGNAQAGYFAKYLRDNHGLDGSSRDDQERAILGRLTGRTVPFAPPTGTTFHHLSERLAFVHHEYVQQQCAKLAAIYTNAQQVYKACVDRGGAGYALPPQ